METSTLNETNSNNNNETSSLIKKCSLFDFKQSKQLKDFKKITKLILLQRVN